MSEDLLYAVRTTFAADALLETFVRYLADVHVKDVLAAGARHAELVRVDGGCAVEVRYRFQSREAFERYDREDGPGLRAHALAFLGEHGVTPGNGVTFARWTGQLVPFAPS